MTHSNHFGCHSSLPALTLTLSSGPVLPVEMLGNANMDESGCSEPNGGFDKSIHWKTYTRMACRMQKLSFSLENIQSNHTLYVILSHFG